MPPLLPLNVPLGQGEQILGQAKSFQYFHAGQTHAVSATLPLEKVSFFPDIAQAVQEATDVLPVPAL